MSLAASFDDAPVARRSAFPPLLVTTLDDVGLPSALPPVPESRPRPGDPPRSGAHLRLVDDFGPIATDLTALPDAGAWLTRAAVPLYEAATGARSAVQVMRWLAPHVHDSVVRRAGRAARRGGATRRPIRLRRVRVAVLPGHASVVEGCAVVDDHRRVRAMAVRLEGLDGRWLVTSLEIG